MLNRWSRLLVLAGLLSCGTTSHAMDYPTLVKSLGPLSYWRLGETSGTTAADEMGVQLGTYSGSTLNQTGALSDNTNPSARFDGVNDYVSLGTMNVSGSAMTIVAWFNADDFGNPNARLISKDNGTSVANHWWTLGTTNLSGSMKLGAILKTSGGNPLLVASGGGLSTGQWTFAALVYNGSTLKLYQNAVEVGSTSLTGALSTSSSVSVRMGRSPSNTDEFDGRIDEVAIFSKALTPAELTQLYQTGRGLVARWKFDETSGTAADDVSAYSNDGTLSGGLSFSSDSVTGQYSRALRFNGASDYISAANSSSLQLTGALTIAAWIKGDAWGAGTDADVIVRKGGENPNNYQLAVADGRVGLFLDQSDTQGIRGGTVLETGRWYHVAATWNGSQVKIYVDGELDAAPVARSGTIATDMRLLYVGGRPGADYFDGVLDDVRVYNYALDQTTIYKIYGLVGYWTFDEGSGSQAADSSGYGHHAALFGDTSWLTGRRDGAVAFDGSGDYVRTLTTFTPPGDGSISFWMKPSGVPPARQRILGLSDSWEIRQETTGRLTFDIDTGSGDGVMETTVTIPPNRWRHVAIVYSASADTYQIYLDGELHKSGAMTLSPQSGSQLSFGVRTGAVDYWHGALDDVRVFDRGLTAEEVAHFGASIAIRIVKWVEVQ